MVASGECGEAIERRFGGTSLLGSYSYDIERSSGTTFLRLYATDDFDAPAYTCEILKDETEPNGFKVVDVSRAR